MKTVLVILFASAGVFALLTGCSSPTMSPTVSAPAHEAAAPAKYSALKDLYVADYGTGTIFLFKNDGYAPDGSITSGISGPWDVTLDRSGNLYVANAAGGNITEYAPGTSTPSFTYSYGMISPRLITVDRQGNLFETDFTDYSGYGTVSEFPQGSNYPVHSCSVFAPWAVATDSSGDVFVDYNISHGAGGRIEEFKGGLAGCTPTELGAQVEIATGLVLDRRNNILIGDFNANRIDVVPPPYSTIAKHLNTGGRGPTFISIDKTNRKVFASVSGFYHSYVFVLNYADGKFEHRLGYARGGFSSPYGVVDAPNAVP
jgi:hypothetical protein